MPLRRPLSPCPSCHRHVWLAESTCPFCAARLGAVAGLATLALAMSGCQPKATSDPSTSDAATAATPDASPVVDSGGLGLRGVSTGAVYGGPAPRRSARDAGPCQCAPGDPLCTCP